jgi:hypothetical protein
MTQKKERERHALESGGTETEKLQKGLAYFDITSVTLVISNQDKLRGVKNES